MKDFIKENIEDLKKWITKEKILAFIVVVLVGIITHISLITGSTTIQDGLWNGMGYNKPSDWEISLGRWGIIIAQRINNFIMIPSIVTVLGIFIVAITTVFIIDIFDIKNKISIMLISIIMVVSPSVTITFIYVHTAIAYFIAFLVSTLSVWFLYKFKYKKVGFILGALLLTFTLAIYQSYIGVIVGMCVMYNILELLKKDKKIKEILLNLIKGAILVIVGSFLYYVITMILLKVLNLSIAEYGGANNVSVVNIFKSLNSTIILAYKDFFEYFIGDTIVYNTNYRRDLLWIGFLIISFISFIIKTIKIDGERKEKSIKIILSIALFIIVPLALNIINVIIGYSDIYALTGTQIILIVPFMFAILENMFEINILYFTCGLIMCSISLTYYLADNTSYTAMNLTYNQSIMTTERILYRIESLEGYNKDMPVAFAGIIDLENFPRSSNLYDYTLGFGVNNTVFHGTYSGQIWTWKRFLELFFGIELPFPSEIGYMNVVNSDEFKEMGIFPDKDSVKIIQDIVVVKLKENPAMPY